MNHKISNNTKHNIIVVGIIIIYMWFLFATDKNDGKSIIILSIIQITIPFIVSIFRLKRTKRILDPSIWFLPVFTLTNIISCIFSFTDGYMYWFEPYREIFKSNALFFLKINSTALIAFYLGNSFINHKIKIDVPYKISNNYNTNTLKKFSTRIITILVLLITFKYYNIYATGGLNLIAENRGVGQFASYGGINYFISIVSHIIFYSLISIIPPIIFLQKENKIINFTLISLVVIYLFPSVFVGSRSTTVFFILSILVSYVLIGKPKSFINFKTIVLSIGIILVMIVFFGYTRDIKSGSMLLYLVNFLEEMQLTSGVAMTTVHFFPNTNEYLYGTTYISAFFNLIPNIFFGGMRPFTNPSLLFHNLFSPDVTDLGYGFSILAEAYMNGGILSVFVFFFLFSIFLNKVLLSNPKNLLSIGMYTLIIISTFWFIRGDSTSYVKTILFGYIFLKLLLIKTK